MTPRQRTTDDADDAVGLIAQRAKNGNLRVTVPLAAITAIMAYMGFDSSHDRDKMREELRVTREEVAVLKESNRNMADAVKRIETKLDEALRERPRR